MRYDRDLEFTLICAVRYALEKQSYMTGYVIRYIRSIVHRLSEWCLDSLWNEIDGHLGDVDHIDRHFWVELQECIRKERTGR